MPDYPWQPGTATGIGSMPGTDMAETLRLVLGDLPDLPYQPELPARGPGADMIGRSAALLLDIAVDLQPSGWRLVSRPGVDLRRTRDLIDRDLDVLLDVAHGHHGLFKIQVTGPWTLAATVELHRGDKVVADPGATRDLAQSLAEGVAAYAGRVRACVPRAELLVQWDEPMLPAVLSGRVPTASGYGVLRAIEEQAAQDALRFVLAAVPDAFCVVHCCSARAPVELLRGAGARAVSLDAGLLPDEDVLGEAVEAGTALWLGLVPATDQGTGPLEPKRLADPARALWRRLGFPDEQLRRQVVVTPTCGLAGASPGYARAALRAARDTARELAE
jgi:methionine synthase II (cobalamin-independent)